MTGEGNIKSYKGLKSLKTRFQSIQLCAGVRGGISGF